MARIIEKTNLNDNTIKFVVKAPAIAKKALPGQFIILRLDEKGERVPFTISSTDDENVTIIVQVVGGTTMRMNALKAGDGFLDFVGPLGKPTELDYLKGKNVCVIGGGLGTAIAYPQAKYLHEIGANVDVIMGFKNKDIIILEDELKASSDNLYITTDDGSYGRQGFVTQVLEDLIEEGKEYDHVLTIGPAIMMKNVVKVTKPHDIPTTVSMNSIMVDGTGMCGCCRLTVGGEMKFACVDGPDFDGFLVDFDEAMNRSRNYATEEREHICNLTGEVRNG
ncbi:MAG: sulfide/dihydroorotate dehydrogenase-like FAD/NAD-binding protein [Anaerococcus sp.]|uniref:sulfide/dihydroorotate dehydrogenase-like FAD/NAD-binding protein n=1 Tax=Anaerococcus sp. TaxID=1872515 RepID=UPI002630C257|nr:sulfide/dihydroorotate dehydrogenase-like FAD/NAD-binding protein [Anaerococcus sp.]MCI5971633.1 sulfide/dihydroorotate dehydrogenase-like FAD/NAD-binding protein [Anaerococcus sp.]MDD6918713.1 sulfide/dihydroorotate dehydrogenase-like FAD/NAD-binding protein [Peptoniphilaceae bacterium]MDY2928148.1 sulfide/dihydroorotate dehydrogenase-like FAD/NAD-binding protein [Anaerococcus sp.]